VFDEQLARWPVGDRRRRSGLRDSRPRQRHLCSAAHRLKGTPSAYKLRGIVANLDTTQHTLQIGTASFSYAADIAPANLANGQIVRLKLQITPDIDGHWVITRFDDGAARPTEGDEVEIESVIASYTSNADFTLSGVITPRRQHRAGRHHAGGRRAGRGRGRDGRRRAGGRERRGQGQRRRWR
jgi:hypothetical protein